MLSLRGELEARECLLPAIVTHLRFVSHWVRSSMPMGNLINTASASSDLIARLAASFSRKDDEEADEVMEDNRARKDNGRASPLHLSEQDLLSLNSAGVDWSTMAELVRLLPSVSVTE